MRDILPIIVILLLTSCNQDSVNKAKQLNKNNPNIAHKSTINSDNSVSKEERVLKLNNNNTVVLKKIENQNSKDLATIDAKKEERLKELEVNSKRDLAQIEFKKAVVDSNKSVKIAKIESSKNVKIKEEESSFYKVAAVILALILIIWGIFRYLTILAKKRQEVELKEREYNHEEYMQELKLKHATVNKMLDIIADENSDKEIKKSLSKLLERGKGNIIEYKK